MATVRQQIVRVSQQALRDYTTRRRIPQNQMEKTAQLLRSEILESVSKGISPIESKGRFPGYKNPDVYPKKVLNIFPNKRTRPVNLFLSGRFYDALRFRIRGNPRLRFGAAAEGPFIELGFFDRSNAIKEKGHREGAGGQPKRPIIPTSGENFSPKIMQRVLQRLVRFLNT